MKIAIQGFEGSFHHMAALEYFGKDLELAEMASFNGLFKVMSDESHPDAAIMAIENSIAGSILPNYQLLQKSKLFVVGEIYMKIQQNLLTSPEAEINDLKEVYSHPMAILQCEAFFSKYPYIKLIESEDTALSAKIVSETGDKAQGAIASTLAAHLYGLKMLSRSIESVKNNFTRFLVLSRKEKKDPDATKASIHFRLNNTPRALLNALQIIGELGVNISKIQSVPEVAREWRYYFHLDLEFDSLSTFYQLSEKLAAHTDEFRLFGIYPKGKTIG